MQKPNKKSRRFQFGIRAILVLTTLFAVLFCCIGLNLYEGLRHQRLAKEFEALGGVVIFTRPYDQTPGGVTVFSWSTLVRSMEPFGLAPVFRRIRGVFWFDRRFAGDNEKVIQLLKEVRQLEILILGETTVADAELSDLINSISAKVITVNDVNLSFTKIDWLNHQGLTYLNVDGTLFSDTAIDNLPESLEYFSAYRTQVTATGLPGLIRLKNLKLLHLESTATSEAAIESLRTEMPWCQITTNPLSSQMGVWGVH